MPQLLIEQFNVASFHITWLEMEPPCFLTSFKVIGWKKGDYQDIKTFILGRPELKTVHLIGEPQPLPYACATFEDRRINPQERMSAVKELILENYYWGHSPNTAVNFWNWTKVTHLELKNISMIKFLRTVPPKHIEKLKRLVLSQDGGQQLGKVTTLMCDLVHKIHALERLSLTCHARQVITSILKHGPTLRSLELYDCPGSKSTYWATLSEADLEAIDASCPNIMELGLEVHFNGDAGPPNAIFFIDSTLSDMRNLRRLKLRSRLVDPKMAAADDTNSYAHLDTTLRNWLHIFLLAKKGANFEMIHIDLRIGEAVSDVFAHVIWVYEAGKGLSKPVIKKD